MTHLTPDEVVAHWQKIHPGDTGAWTHRFARELAEAGLVVVDVTDTPNDIDESPHEAGVLLPWCPRCGSATRSWRPAANTINGPESECSHGWHDWTGGSPGGSGTVTQETSTARWSYREQEDAAHLLIDRGVVVGSIFHPHNVEHIATVLNDAEHLDKPFPGAHPGPVVDGQPTWGAYLRDVPDKGYECHNAVTDDVTGERSIWRPVNGSFQVMRWVLVRRAPQPATERVPWWEAKGRTLMTDGRSHGICYGVIDYDLSADPDGNGPQALYMDGLSIVRVRPDDDGTVEVLVENEETGT